MIALVVTYVISPSHESDAEHCLRELIAATRREPGCKTYEVHRARDDARTFLIYECYDDEAALEAHRATERFRRYGTHGLQTMMESRSATLYEPFG